MTFPKPDRRHLWQTLRLVGACALAYAFAELLALKEGYWSLITAIVVTQPMLADTLSAGRDRVAGTLIGALIGFGVLVLVQRGWPELPLFWVTLVPVSLLVAMRPYLRLSAVTLVVVVLVPGAGSPYVRPFDRVIEILLGTVAAVIVATIIRPKLWRRGGLTAVTDNASGNSDTH